MGKARGIARCSQSTSAKLDDAALLDVVEVEVLPRARAMDAGLVDDRARGRLPLVAVHLDRVLDLDADGALVDGPSVPGARAGQIERLVHGAVAIEEQLHAEAALEQHLEALMRRRAAIPVQHEEVHALARGIAPPAPATLALEGEPTGFFPGDHGKRHGHALASDDEVLSRWRLPGRALQRGPGLGAEGAVDRELAVLVLEPGHVTGKGFAADVTRPARGHTPAEPLLVVGVEPLRAAEPSWSEQLF